MNLGLRKSQIETIVRRKLEKEPDLKYYVDNDYVMRLVDLLVEGVAEAIDRNNDELDRQLRR